MNISTTISQFTLSEKMLNSTSSFNHNDTYRLITRCLSIYALILVIVGTLGNLLTIIILCRRNLRRYVTMRYLIAVSICDIISLYGWNLNNFYKFTISSDNNNLEELSLAHCRIMSYMTFVGLQLSSWCLTAVSIGKLGFANQILTKIYKKYLLLNVFISSIEFSLNV
jgi:hypothetical protein